MTCSLPQPKCGKSTTSANAKRDIVNHLVRNVFVRDARFQDAMSQIRTPNARRQLHFESIFTDRMSQLNSGTEGGGMREGGVEAEVRTAEEGGRSEERRVG